MHKSLDSMVSSHSLETSREQLPFLEEAYTGERNYRSFLQDDSTTNINLQHHSALAVSTRSRNWKLLQDTPTLPSILTDGDDAVMCMFKCNTGPLGTTLLLCVAATCLVVLMTILIRGGLQPCFSSFSTQFPLYFLL